MDYLKLFHLSASKMLLSSNIFRTDFVKLSNWEVKRVLFKDELVELNFQSAKSGENDLI